MKKLTSGFLALKNPSKLVRGISQLEKMIETEKQWEALPLYGVYGYINAIQSQVGTAHHRLPLTIFNIQVKITNHISWSVDNFRRAID